jgi:hypothetical protein
MEHRTEQNTHRHHDENIGNARAPREPVCHKRENQQAAEQGKEVCKIHRALAPP